MLRADAKCCASFGELLQGVLPDGEHFLVTLPIDLHTQAHFSFSRRMFDLEVSPPDSSKVLRLVEALLRRYDLPLSGKIRLQSEIPRGKGLASSTADMVAAYRAVTRCYRLPWRLDVLEQLLREIEPSDGVMHEGVVAYCHREARLHRRLGPVPAFTLVGIDEGGVVRTEAHNARKVEYPKQVRDEYASLLDRLHDAFALRDTVQIGAVATRSAQLNQRVLPKRWFDVTTRIAADIGAAGVIAAHSGTYLGVLIDARSADHDAQVRQATASIQAKGLKPALFSSLTG